MARKRFDDMNCGAAQALEQIGDWWTLLIVREAFYGTRTFSEFQRRLGIAKNILTDRLNQLVLRDILRKQPVGSGTKNFEYLLTDKGSDLLTVLVALMQWGDKWVFGAGNEPVRILDRETREAIARVAVAGKSGTALTIEGLRFQPGPGADATTLEKFADAKHRGKTIKT